MDLPAACHPLWEELVCGEHSDELEFLAAKLLLVRLRMALEPKSPTLKPMPLGECAHQLHALYAANANLPSARRDLDRLSRWAAARRRIG